MSELIRAAASAVGGRTARACDSCLRRRARWFCAADDAFLCQACDAAVHSANPLARRHHRLRLKTSSSSSSSPLSSHNNHTASLSDLLNPSDDDDNSDHKRDHKPKWHHGFKRKARTPRPKPGGSNGHHRPLAKSSESLVPDLEAAALADMEEEEQHDLLYRVPIFDPVLAEFCSFSQPPQPLEEAVKPAVAAQQQFDGDLSPETNSNEAGLAGFLPSEKELEEFAADMETLLGRGLEDGGGAFCIDDFSDSGTCGVASVKTENSMDDCAPMELVNIEDRFDHEQKTPTMMSYEEEDHRRLFLRLDYDAVIESWSSGGSTSPWTGGQRPDIKPEECWHEFMGKGSQGMYFDRLAAVVRGGNSGREARVSRYREKRRTRLFSKKIRYEVRKLNAEKRPRMKGRFIKRAASFQPPAAPATFAY